MDFVEFLIAFQPIAALYLFQNSVNTTDVPLCVCFRINLADITFMVISTVMTYYRNILVYFGFELKITMTTFTIWFACHEIAHTKLVRSFMKLMFIVISFGVISFIKQRTLMQLADKS